MYCLLIPVYVVLYNNVILIGFLHATSRDIVAAENDNVTIGFKIEGDDPIYQVDDFEWYYTNLSNITQGVVTNDRLSLTNDLRNLTITSVQLKDRGNYTLEINNQRSSIVNLDVKSKWHIVMLLYYSSNYKFLQDCYTAKGRMKHII